MGGEIFMAAGVDAVTGTDGIHGSHGLRNIAEPSSEHSLKNRTENRTGKVVGSGFYRSDRRFTGSIVGFLRNKIIYID